MVFYFNGLYYIYHKWMLSIKRRNRTILEYIRTMISHANIPNYFAAMLLTSSPYYEAMFHLMQLIKSNIKYGRERNLIFIHESSGCLAFARRIESDKGGNTFAKCFFVGYPK